MRIINVGDELFNFQLVLLKAGYVTTVRTTRGDDIDAACGQLVGQVQDRTRRSSQWQKKIQPKMIDVNDISAAQRATK